MAAGRRHDHPNTDTDTDADADANAHAHADTLADTDADTYTDADADAHTDTDADMRGRAVSARQDAIRREHDPDGRRSRSKRDRRLDVRHEELGRVAEPGTWNLPRTEFDGHLPLPTMMSNLQRSHSADFSKRGQGLVEFSLALIPFVLVLMGIVDLGRGIYMYNGVSEAAREIARVTAVHPGTTLGDSSQTQGVIGTQKNLVPGLADATATITFSCTTISDAAIAGPGCATTTSQVAFVRVQISVPFGVLTPLLSMVAPTTLSATAHVQVP